MEEEKTLELKMEFQTNIAGKVRNTKLRPHKALWPLFEMISNGIHAIEERDYLKNGFIEIRVIRNGKEEVLAGLEEVGLFPINSFEIRDNGIGFNDENMQSFLTAESEYKIEKGAKGIGRFVALKAFHSVTYESNYQQNETDHFKRNFELKPTGKGIFNYENTSTDEKRIGTNVKLERYRATYQKYVPKRLEDLAEQIVTHFLIYFMQDKAPLIQLIDGNGESIILQDYYKNNVEKSIKSAEFQVINILFKIWILKVHHTKKTHTIHFCGNERVVRDEPLTKDIPDLGKKIIDDNGDPFVYHAYITSTFLDNVVEGSRTGFDIITEEEVADDENEITIKKIRTESISKIEELLTDYLEVVRSEKFKEYETHIYENAPQFKAILKYEPESIKRMKPNLRGNKLDIELYKLQNKLEVSVKELGEEILNNGFDYENSDEYKERYSEYIAKFNDVGKADLAKYIVHRKAVIELLDKFLGADEEGKFQSEETIHNIFFPIRTESDEITYDQQNLWLIDERMAYHSYLASDKTLNSMKITSSKKATRPDLLIFNDSFLFVEDHAPHGSFTIVEFKKPERDDYKPNDQKKNPVDQVFAYIEEIRANKAVDKRGKKIQFGERNNTPFYAYIVVDINEKLIPILDKNDFKPTPDGMGYFRYHSNFNAYIEVLTYSKVLKDAKNRNRILFDKLGLPTN